MNLKHLRTLFRKTVCSIVSASILVLPCWAWGGETNMSAIGKNSQKFGAEKAAEFLKSPPRMEGNNYTFTGQDGKSMTLSSDELGAKNSAVKQKFSAEDVLRIKGLMQGSDESSNTRGNEVRDELYTDVTTIEGQAYGILLKGSNVSRPDWNQSAMLDKTADAVSGYKETMKWMSDCTSKMDIVTNQKTVRLPDYQVCQQVLDRSGTCELHHNYTAGIIRHYSGPFNVTSCGEGCIQVWIGDPSDQNMYAPKNGCVLHERTIVIEIVNPEAITSATMDGIYWDDQMQIWFGPQGRETKLFQLPYPETFVPSLDPAPGVRPKFVYPGPFSGAAHTACQQKWSWKWMDPLDITQYLRSAKKNELYTFKLRVAVQDKGEGYARIRINYDPKKAVVDESWTPVECIESLTAIRDGFAQGTFECTDMPAVNSNGCAVFDSVTVCPKDLNPSPVPGISPLCRSATIKSAFNFYKGQMDCWTDVNGERHCPTNTGGNLNACPEMLKKLSDQGKKCSFVESKCTEGAQGQSGVCYANDLVYDCGKDVVVSDTETVTTYKCEGEAHCMGDECTDYVLTENDSFAKVNAMLNALQYVGQDMDCTGLDENGRPYGDTDVNCNAFAGTPGTCKIAVGGVQDCCENQQPIGMTPYLSVLSIASKAVSAMTAEGVDTDLTGSWVQNWDFAEFGSGLGDTVMDGLTPNIAGAYNNYMDSMNRAYNSTFHYSTETTKYLASDPGGALTSHGAFMEQMGNIAEAGFATAGYIQDFTTLIENIGDVKGMIRAVAQMYVKHLMKKVGEYAMEEIQKIFMQLAKDYFKDFVKSEATDKATEMAEDTAMEMGAEAMGAAMAALGAIAAVYAAYCMAITIIQMVWKCTDEELELVVQRDIRNCTYLGSYCKKKILGACIEKRRAYCCFNSPLSRIVQEQIRKQGQISGFKGFGSVKNPNCEGVPLDQLDKIDWDRINLDEWTAILKETGKFPTAENINPETLTGKDAHMNWDGERMNTIDRNVLRTNQVNADKTRVESALAMPVDTGFEGVTRPDENLYGSPKN